MLRALTELLVQSPRSRSWFEGGDRATAGHPVLQPGRIWSFGFRGNSDKALTLCFQSPAIFQVDHEASEQRAEEDLGCLGKC